MTAYVFKRKRPPVLQYTGDYTKTGSFGQINKGVASGFTTANYLTIADTFPIEDKHWEFVTKFNLSDVATEQRIFGSNGNVYGLAIQIKSGKLDVYVSSNGSSWNVLIYQTGVTTFEVNKDYWLKFEYTGDKYVASISTDNISWNTEFSIDSTTPLRNFGTVYLGSNVTTLALKGSIDLSQSYININGERWWSGDSYTKVGGWIDDNVVSGFSSNNYLQLPKTFNGNVGNTWEMVWKFRLNSDYTSVKDHGILACSTTVPYASSVGVNGSTKVAYVSLATNTSGSKLVMLSTTTTLEPETDYWVKVDFTGTAYNLYLSTNGTDYNLEATKESTSKWTSYTLSKIGYRNDNTVYPFKGSIDLTESYIKVDDEYWWQGAKYVREVLNYIIKRKQYWKYEYEDYTLPVMTSNTAPEGVVTYDIGIGGPYATSSIYQIFWNSDKSININGLYNQATRYMKYTFAKLLKAGKYTFTYSASRQASVTNTMNKWEVILEDDSKVEIMNPTVTTSSQTFSAEFEVNKPIKAINLTLYASAPSEASCYYMISKIALTGEGLPENTVTVLKDVVKGSPDDYDFTTNKAYILRRK